MGGCISVEWARVQQQYYDWLGIQKTGRRWAIAVIKRLWQTSWDMWDNRNEFIHSTPMAADLNGAVLLDEAIKKECQLGNDGLPEAVKRTFPVDVNTLLVQPLIQRKHWFILVRASRELIQDRRIQDEFTDPQSHLRKWVGLLYGK